MYDDELNHYSSPYYDPVKAHEYYMKNRKLKGRTTSGMSDEQKEAWRYSKDQITTEKKATISAEQQARDAQIADLREKATATKARISEKLKLLSAKLTAKAKEEREDISEEVKAKIDALPPIPKGISAEKRAKLSAERKEAIAKIRGEANADRSELSEDTKKERASNSAEAKAHRDNVTKTVKTLIQATRDNFKKKKEEITKKYEDTYQKEYDNIKANIAGKPAKAKKTKKTKKK